MTNRNILHRFWKWVLSSPKLVRAEKQPQKDLLKGWLLFQHSTEESLRDHGWPGDSLAPKVLSLCWALPCMTYCLLHHSKNNRSALSPLPSFVSAGSILLDKSGRQHRPLWALVIVVVVVVAALHLLKLCRWDNTCKWSNIHKFPLAPLWVALGCRLGTRMVSPFGARISYILVRKIPVSYCCCVSNLST